MSYLYKRGDVWWGRLRIRGRPERKRSLRTTSKSEALQRLKDWEKAEGRLAFGGTGRHKWEEAVARFDAYGQKSLKPDTLKRYWVSLKQVEPYLLGKWIDELAARDMAKIASRSGPSNATRRRDLTAVAGVLRVAVAEGWLETNIAKTWDRGIIHEHRDPITLPSYRAIAAAIQKCPQMLGRLMLALLQTGMRLEEMGGLQTGNLSLKRSEIVLTRTKTSRARTVKLTDAARGTFEGTPRYMGEPWVFWHDKGARYANLSSRLKELIGKSGGKFRNHDLRHRYAVDFLRLKRGSIYDLQQQLGHSSVKTTEIYLAYVGDSDATDDDWPSPIPLQDMSYERIMGLQLGGTNGGTPATVSDSEAQSKTAS